MSASIQAWIAIVGGLATALVGILKYFNYKSRRDRLTIVGQSFSATVDALASPDEVKQLAAAILLRRFFDRRTEQGTAGAPYQQEAIRVIAALLRTAETGELQKLLADGLASAPDLQGADLQQCNLENAYLGKRRGRRVNLSDADLFRADLTRASLKEATAQRTVFYEATLTKAVLEGADLTDADLRDAKLEGARFAGATIGGAKFAGASNVPPAVLELLDDDGRAPEGATVPGNSEPGLSGRIFISYARADREFAVWLRDALSGAGLETWIDEVEIAPAAEWQPSVERAIEAAGTFAFVVSEDSLRSEQCLTELRHARAHGKPILAFPAGRVSVGTGPDELAGAVLVPVGSEDDLDAVLRVAATAGGA